MSDVQFFQTRMGQQFYDGTMPKIAEALERIATALEALNQAAAAAAAVTPYNPSDAEND